MALLTNGRPAPVAQYTLSTLPTPVFGRLIYVTDAQGGQGTICYAGFIGSPLTLTWIDILTGVEVDGIPPPPSFEVASLTYDSVSFTTLPVVEIGSGFTFKPDGTKLYMTSQFPQDGMYEVSLLTPWDITTAFFGSPSVFIDTSSVQSGATDMKFHPDGTRLFLLGLSPFDGVHEYVLATPWELSTAALASPIASFSVTAQSISPQSFAFNADGTKMFVSSSSPAPTRVFEYTLSIPWDITTASYGSPGVSYNVSLDFSGTPAGLTFKPDGTKMYIVSTTPDRVHQYSLSTPWDLTTVSIDAVKLDISGEISTGTELEWKPDGSKLFVLSQNPEALYQYGV